jgi:hypothetical protein
LQRHLIVRFTRHRSRQSIGDGCPSRVHTGPLDTMRLGYQLVSTRREKPAASAIYGLEPIDDLLRLNSVYSALVHVEANDLSVEVSQQVAERVGVAFNGLNIVRTGTTESRDR